MACGLKKESLMHTKEGRLQKRNMIQSLASKIESLEKSEGSGKLPHIWRNLWQRRRKAEKAKAVDMQLLLQLIVLYCVYYLIVVAIAIPLAFLASGAIMILAWIIGVIIDLYERVRK